MGAMGISLRWGGASFLFPSPGIRGHPYTCHTIPGLLDTLEIKGGGVESDRCGHIVGGDAKTRSNHESQRPAARLYPSSQQDKWGHKGGGDAILGQAQRGEMDIFHPNTGHIAAEHCRLHSCIHQRSQTGGDTRWWGFDSGPSLEGGDGHLPP